MKAVRAAGASAWKRRHGAAKARAAPRATAPPAAGRSKGWKATAKRARRASAAPGATHGKGVRRARAWFMVANPGPLCIAPDVCLPAGSIRNFVFPSIYNHFALFGLLAPVDD